MREAVTYPLNPVDNVLLATHESLRQRGYCGLNVMLIADLEGPLDCPSLCEAVRRLGRHYPALSARIRLTRFGGRAYWEIAPDAELEKAVEYEHHLANPSATDVDEPLRRALNHPLDPREGPYLRLVHVEMGPERHRLGLRWPHFLMDMEGGHLLFRELHAVLSDQPVTLGADPTAVLVRPYAHTFASSLLRAWQGRLRYAYLDGLHQPRLVARPDDGQKIVGFVVRHYDASRRARFEALARARTAPGPLRYTRALMVSCGRVYTRMARERGRPRERYLFSHALPVPRAGPRPGVHGNYVVIPWIAFTGMDLQDRARADAVALRQFQAHLDRGWNEAVWEMLRAAQRWPLSTLAWLMGHRIPRAAAGCTSYRFGDNLTRFGAARITNLSGAGPMNCHPGWLIGHVTFRDTMTLSITYFEDYLNSASVHEFLDRLEQEIFT